MKRWWSRYGLDVSLAVSVGLLAGWLTLCIQQGWL